MAGTKSDFVVNDELFSSVYLERLGQMTDAFNAASNGAITLTSQSKLGDFEKVSFFKQMSEAQMIKHRDPDSLSVLTPEKLEQLEKVNVKLNRTIGPVENTLDSFKKIGQSGDLFTIKVAEAAAEASQADQLNTAITCLMGSIQSEAGMLSGDGTTAIAYTDIADLLAKYGDQLGSIKLLAMHSSTYYSLMQTAIGEKLWNVAGNSINNGANPTMGIPTLVTDSDALGMTLGKGVLALTEGAIRVVDSETATAEVQRVLGKANITMLYQGESAYNIDVKGYSYDVVAGVSPTNTVLADPTTWNKSATELKATAGAIFNCSI